MNENITKKGERKSLFSIQVDDLIIQRIFKTLEDEICKIRVEITDIQAKLSEKAEKNDLIELKTDIREFKEKSDIYRDKMDSDMISFHDVLNTAVAETKKYARDQITEATVSLNGVVRAQNAIIEERIFQLSRPDSEITHALADLERVKRNNTTLSGKISNIESFFSSFLNNTGDSNMTLPEIISHYFDPEREKIRNIELHQKKSDGRIQECENKITCIVGSDEIKFPVFVKAQKHHFHEKPKIPEFPTPKNYTDYFQYMAIAFPAIQKILSSFYHQVVGLSNSVYDQAERETSQEDLERSLREVMDIIADVRELKEGQSKIDTLSSQVEEINSSQKKIDDMLNEINHLKETTISRTEVDDEIKKAVSDLMTEIQILKTENLNRNESPNRLSNSKNSAARNSFTNTILYLRDKDKEESKAKSPLHQISTAPLQPVKRLPLSNDDNNTTNAKPPPLPPPQLQQQHQDEEQLKNPQLDADDKTEGDEKSARNSANGSGKNTERGASTSNCGGKEAASSSVNSPNGSTNHRHKVSSAVQSPRIMKPEIHVGSSAASTVSLPETVVTAVQPKGRAAYRMIFGDTSGSRPGSAASSTASSRMSSLTSLNVQRAEDLEVGGKAPKRTLKTATPVVISTEGLPEEKDDSLDFFNIF